MISHELTITERVAFLARHPNVAARVVEFEAIVGNVGYDQAPTPPGGWNIFDADLVDYYLRMLPGWIPSWGIAVEDSVWPYVVIFPDAVGDLRMTGTDVVQAVHINDPEPATIPDTAPMDYLMWALAIGAVIALGVWVPKLRQ